MHVTKLLAYREAAVLPLHAVGVGAALGSIMIGGSYLGKRILDRRPEHVFVWIIEAVLVGAGCGFCWHADVRTLIVSDVHGNWAALDAVLAEPHDAAICLGDLVGYGPEPHACVAWARKSG